MRQLLALLLGCAIPVAGCSSAEGTSELVVHRGLDVAGITVTDVVAPADGEDLPVVVMLHGTGGEREVLEPLARAVAAEGVVVYLPTWPVIDQVGSATPTDDEPYRRQAEAVVCSLRYVRRTAPDHGGDPDDLTLYGHSGGATAGARVALVRSPLPWPGIDCDPDVAHEPERFIATGGDFSGDYQYSAECPDLFAPYDPFQIEPSNRDLEVRLIHGFYDTAVDARVSLLFDGHLDVCGLDSAAVVTDSGHSDMRDPSTPAGRFVADQIVALVQGRESVFDRTADEAVVDFGETGDCRYDGPTEVSRDEPLRIEIRNATVGDLLWFALVRLRPEVPVTLDDLRADRTSSGDGPPAFVSYGGFTSVPAGETATLDWVFVDGDASWAVYCMPDPNPTAPMRQPSFVMWGGTALRPAAIVSAAS